MITYKINKEISVEQFIGVLNRSTLGERRPVDDLACIQSMLNNSDIIVTAWEDEKIIGVARSVTDYSYCCYLSDLAVDQDFQKQGIGKKLIEETQTLLGPKCKVILLSAPAAVEYYPKIGFEKHPQCWIKK